MKWLLIFTVAVTADYFWARYTAHVSDKNRVRSAWYSFLIILCSGFTVVEYTQDHWLLVPAALGAAVGTFIAVKPS